MAPESSAPYRGLWSQRTLQAFSAAVIFDGVGLLGPISNWSCFRLALGTWWKQDFNGWLTWFSFLLKRAICVVYTSKLVVVVGCLLILFTKFALHTDITLSIYQVELSQKALSPGLHLSTITATNGLF